MPTSNLQPDFSVNYDPNFPEPKPVTTIGPDWFVAFVFWLACIDLGLIAAVIVAHA